MQKWGYWDTDHNSEDSSNPVVNSSKFPPVSAYSRTGESSQPNRPKKTVIFHMAQKTSPSDSLDRFIGRLLNDRAPYIFLGLNELKLL